MVSTFRGVLEFFEKLGIYDVLLPFILVFSIVFAVLEKSKILGTEKWEKEDIPKRNLNSLVAFSVAFLVVASSHLVATINQALAQIAVVMIASIFFLLLIATFHGDDKVELKNNTWWRSGGMIVMLLAIILIFLNSLKTKTGVSWLEWAWDYVIRNWNGTIVSTIILLIVLVGGMALIIKTPKEVPVSGKETPP